MGARHRASHRKSRVVKQSHNSLRGGGRRRERVVTEPAHLEHGGTAGRLMRPYVAASVAVLGASVIAVTPVEPAPPAPPALRAASADVSLAAASSPLYIPLNLMIDIINIPHYEIQAFEMLGRAQMFSGPWFVVSASNLWGIDPGDVPRIRALTGILVPLAHLSGIDADPLNDNYLGQQLWQFLAAQLPVSDVCDASNCPPTVPTSPITGIPALDSTLWSLAILTGQHRFPLFNNWLKAGLGELLSGYTFDPATTPGLVSPSGPVHSEPAWDGFLGTNAEGEYPWAHDEFELNPFMPLQSYLNHLMDDPFDDGEFPVKLPNIGQLARAVQTFIAGMVIAYWPLTPGSFMCPGACEGLPDFLDYPAIVKFIGDVWPGNEDINTWLNAYENGTANVPTDEQIAEQIALFKRQQQPWSFGNPSPESDVYNSRELAEQFHAFWTALGFNPPPLDPAPAEPGEETTDTESGEETADVDVLASDSVDTLPVSEEGTLPQAGEEASAQLMADPSTLDINGTEESTVTVDEEAGSAGAEAPTPPIADTPPAIKPEETPAIKPEDQNTTGSLVRDSLNFSPGAHGSAAADGSLTTPSGGGETDTEEAVADAGESVGAAAAGAGRSAGDGAGDGGGGGGG
jgi:hypothetical protein